jgi:uncharacterized protein (DUF433 family)
MAKKIVCDPKIMVGKPTFEGTRIPVHIVLDMMADGASIDDVLVSYPTLDESDVRAALGYAARYVEAPVQTIAAE